MLDKKPTKFFIFSLFYLVAAYFFKDLIPAHCADENCFIENFQLLILSLGVILSLYFHKNTTIPKDKYIWSAIGLLFAICFFRELSWGRTLFIHSDGTIPYWEEFGLYGKIIHPLVAIVLCIVSYLLYKGNLYKFMLTSKLPLYDCLLVFILIIIITVAEKDLFLSFHGEMAEELTELLLYSELCFITNQIGKSKIVNKKSFSS